jgi:predicted DsbA family dithiol-disulfide isomerase
MPTSVMLFSDYVCPWCYMGATGLDQLRQTRPIEVALRAYELRPAGTPPMPPELEAQYRERIAAGWPRVQQMALERFGLELKRMDDPAPRSTRLAHIGAKFAIARGQGEAYHLAVFRAHWQELRDISSVDTLAEIARAVGLDEAAFRAALENPEYRDEVETDEYWAAQQQLSGVPAFIFAERYLVSGAQPLEVLQQVVDRCVQEGLSS